jgi:hypothetical protein
MSKHKKHIMAPLSKLILTSYRRTQPNRDPVEERRNKTLVALEQQKLVLAAALNGQKHTITKPGWARDASRNRQRVKKTHAGHTSVTQTLTK